MASLVEENPASRVNGTYLPGIKLPDLVSPTASLEVALRDVSCLVAAVPSHGTRDVVRRREAMHPSERGDRQRDEGVGGRHAAPYVGGDRA